MLTTGPVLASHVVDWHKLRVFDLGRNAVVAGPLAPIVDDLAPRALSADACAIECAHVVRGGSPSA